MLKKLFLLLSVFAIAGCQSNAQSSSSASDSVPVSSDTSSSENPQPVDPLTAWSATDLAIIEEVLGAGISIPVVPFITDYTLAKDGTGKIVYITSSAAQSSIIASYFAALGSDFAAFTVEGESESVTIKAKKVDEDATKEVYLVLMGSVVSSVVTFRATLKEVAKLPSFIEGWPTDKPFADAFGTHLPLIDVLEEGIDASFTGEEGEYEFEIKLEVAQATALSYLDDLASEGYILDGATLPALAEYRGADKVIRLDISYSSEKMVIAGDTAPTVSDWADILSVASLGAVLDFNPSLLSQLPVLPISLAEAEVAFLMDNDAGDNVYPLIISVESLDFSVSYNTALSNHIGFQAVANNSEIVAVLDSMYLESDMLVYVKSIEGGKLYAAAYYNDYYASTELLVFFVPDSEDTVTISSVTIGSLPEGAMDKGSTHQLSVAVVASVAGPDNEAVVWTSSHPTVIAVDENGMLSAGDTSSEVVKKVTITATSAVDSKKSDSIQVSLNIAITSFAIVGTVQATNDPENTIIYGKTVYTQRTTLLAISATPDATKYKHDAVTWTSSDTDIVQVGKSSDSITFNGKGVGSVTITATSTVDSSKKASFTLNVIPDVTSLAITNAATQAIKVGGTHKLGHTITSSPNTAPHNNVAWTSSAESVATIDSTGLVTAVAIGTTTITLKSVGDERKSATTTITVVEITSISASGSTDITLNEAEDMILAVTVVSNPDNSIHKGVNWTSSDDTSVIVSTAGKITAKKVTVAPVQITATSKIDASKSVTFNVTVNAAAAADWSAAVKADLETILGAGNSDVLPFPTLFLPQLAASDLYDYCSDGVDELGFHATATGVSAADMLTHYKSLLEGIWTKGNAGDIDDGIIAEFEMSSLSDNYNNLYYKNVDGIGDVYVSLVSASPYFLIYVWVQ